MGGWSGWGTWEDVLTEEGLVLVQGSMLMYQLLMVMVMVRSLKYPSTAESALTHSGRKPVLDS